MKILYLLILTNFYFLHSINAQSVKFSAETLRYLNVGSIEPLTWTSNGIENINIEYSIDAGKTWKLIIENYKAENGLFEWIVPNTPSIFCQLKIYDSSDSNTFSIIPDLSSSGYKNIFFNIIGENKWKYIQSNTNYNLNNINFLDSLNGIIWGNSTLLVTNNGGITWDIKSEFSEKNLLDVIFIDDKKGFAYKNNEIFSTNDGGVNWVSVYSNSEINWIRKLTYQNGFIYYISFENYNNLEHSNSLFKIDEFGTNNQKIFSLDSLKNHLGYYIYLESIENFNYINESIGYITLTYFLNESCYGNYITQDGGSTWQSIESMFFDISILENLNLWGIWVYNYPNYIGYGIRKLDQDKKSSILYEFTVLTPGTNQLEKIHFYNNEIGWLLGRVYGYNRDYDIADPITISKSSDGGVTWDLQFFGSTYDNSKINNLYSFDGKTCWAVGDSGTILKSNDEITDVKNVDKKLISNFTLYQNYPNPFNPSTTIKYSIPSNAKNEKSNVKLIVYDILGKEVATLINENKSFGNYEVVFDGTNLSTGVYYYQLKTGDFVQTKKMVLIK
ncbi:MAG: T9SS type A sorting domain-containing protein [Ignavibacteriae bacterium]|nr:T9SS type A sorting domain-containing protein [Ignavibacteriota bacterium]